MAAKRIREVDRGWAKIEAAIRGTGKGATVKIGVLDTAEPYPDGTPVAVVALAHEYGQGVPARPFMRPAIDAGAHVLAAESERIAKFVIAGGRITPQQIGDRLGEIGRRLVLQRMQTGPFIPLATSTIARKGHARPLLDTLRLYDSISYEVIGTKGGVPPTEPHPISARAIGFGHTQRILRTVLRAAKASTKL